jgi:hypothetical protein
MELSARPVPRTRPEDAHQGIWTEVHKFGVLPSQNRHIRCQTAGSFHGFFHFISKLTFHKFVFYSLSL